MFCYTTPDSDGKCVSRERFVPFVLTERSDRGPQRARPGRLSPPLRRNDVGRTANHARPSGFRNRSLLGMACGLGVPFSLVPFCAMRSFPELCFGLPGVRASVWRRMGRIRSRPCAFFFLPFFFGARVCVFVPVLRWRISAQQTRDARGRPEITFSPVS